MPGRDTSGWTKEDWLIQRYKYVPSEPTAIAFAAIFGLTTLVHLFQLVTSKTLYFIPFLMGGLFETTGYILRTMDVEKADLILFINQTTLILLAPALYAASIYMILKRLVLLLQAQDYSIISVRWLTRFFVGCDILSFLTQGAGGGIYSSASGKPNRRDLGKWLIVAGLLMQLVAFGFFAVVIAVFHTRIVRRPTAESRTSSLPWKRYIFVLYGASLIIVIRSIFRLVEYIQGREGYLMAHEVYSYALDAAMMVLVSLLFNVFHPSRIVSSTARTRIETKTGYRM